SILSLNFTVERSFSRLTAASTEYCLLASIFSRIAFCLLVNLAISNPLDFQAHATRRTSNSPHRGIHISSSQIRHLASCDFFELRTSYLANFVLVGDATAFLYTSNLAQQS